VKPLPAGTLQLPPLTGADEDVSETVRVAVLPHAGQAISASGARWIFSVSFPQTSQRYS